MTYIELIRMSTELRQDWIDENPEEFQRICDERNALKNALVCGNGACETKIYR